MKMFIVLDDSLSSTVVHFLNCWRNGQLYHILTCTTLWNTCHLRLSYISQYKFPFTLCLTFDWQISLWVSPSFLGLFRLSINKNYFQKVYQSDQKSNIFKEIVCDKHSPINAEDNVCYWIPVYKETNIELTIQNSDWGYMKQHSLSSFILMNLKFFEISCNIQDVP